MTPTEWILGPDTGCSSRTIWGVMMGKERYHLAMPPADPSDFGRCYRLLQHFPEWRNRLCEVSVMYPEWAALVIHWDELTRLYEEENSSRSCPKLYARMCELQKQKE